MKSKMKNESTTKNKSKEVVGNLSTHADDMATFKTHVGAAVTDLQQVAADMGAFGLHNVHVSEVVKLAIHELSRAYGQKQGT